MIPPELKAIEDDIAPWSACDSGFKEDGSHLFWFASWAGDAPGDNPRDTTREALWDAWEEIENIGWVCSEAYNEHDYASFTVERKRGEEMAKVTLKEIGPAERQIAQLLISDITTGDRNNARMAKGIRRQLRLRQLRHEMDGVTTELQDRLIADLGPAPGARHKPDDAELAQVLSNTELAVAQAYQQQVTAIRQQVTGVPWSTLLDEGYNEQDEYGESYDVDGTTLQWLNDRRTERKVWLWQTDERGLRKLDKSDQPIPRELSPEMLEAIGNLDDAMQQALGAESPETEVTQED